MSCGDQQQPDIMFFLRPTPGFKVDVQKLDTLKFGKRQEIICQ